MGELDWDEITNTPAHPALGFLASEATDADIHSAVLVIGWRLGLVTLEDLEIQLIGEREATPAEVREATIRLFGRLLARLQGLAKLQRSEDDTA